MSIVIASLVESMQGTTKTTRGLEFWLFVLLVLSLSGVIAMFVQTTLLTQSFENWIRLLRIRCMDAYLHAWPVSKRKRPILESINKEIKFILDQKIETLRFDLQQVGKTILDLFYVIFMIYTGKYIILFRKSKTA
jgi:hypothetical protein